MKKKKEREGRDVCTDKSYSVRPFLSSCNYTCWSDAWCCPPCKLWPVYHHRGSVPLGCCSHRAETQYCRSSHQEPWGKLLRKGRFLRWCELVSTMGFNVHVGFSPVSPHVPQSHLNISVPRAIQLHANTQLIFLWWGWAEGTIAVCSWPYPERAILASFFFLLSLSFPPLNWLCCPFPVGRLLFWTQIFIIISCQ